MVWIWRVHAVDIDCGLQKTIWLPESDRWADRSVVMSRVGGGGGHHVGRHRGGVQQASGGCPQGLGGPRSGCWCWGQNWNIHNLILKYFYLPTARYFLYSEAWTRRHGWAAVWGWGISGPCETAAAGREESWGTSPGLTAGRGTAPSTQTGNLFLPQN